MLNESLHCVCALPISPRIREQYSDSLGDLEKTARSFKTNLNVNGNGNVFGISIPKQYSIVAID